MDRKHIIVVGNPVDGLTFIGPFNNGTIAHEYADRTNIEEWWAASLQKPDDNILDDLTD